MGRRIDGKINHPRLNGVGACLPVHTPEQRKQVIEASAMTSHSASRRSKQRYQRIRTLALSVGMVLGMAAATFGPQWAHAAVNKAPKHGLVEKLAKLPEATAEQLQAAERVLLGRYRCEFGKSVSVDRNKVNAGYFDLKFGNKTWLMKPSVTETGTVRLEDLKGTTMLLQILTKSMLMDRQAGHRLVDGCVHDVQRAAEADLAKQPPRESIFGDLAKPGNN